MPYTQGLLINNNFNKESGVYTAKFQIQTDINASSVYYNGMSKTNDVEIDVVINGKSQKFADVF